MARDPSTSELSTPAAGKRVDVPLAAGEVVFRAPVPAHGGAALLLAIAERRLTGVLELATEVGRRVINLHSGLPVFAQSSLVSERLGTVGVRHGFFGRADVARALAAGKEQERELGQALIDIGVLDAPGLVALLSVQVRELVVASCGASVQRARLTAGPLSRDVMVLRLHPLTVAMSALAAFPHLEQERALVALGTQRLVARAPSPLVLSWLADLGYMGDLSTLANGEPTVQSLRSRLLARQRALAEKAFDPEPLRFASPAARLLLPARTPAAMADAVTLTLLLANAVTLMDTAVAVSGGDSDGASGVLGFTSDALLATLRAFASGAGLNESLAVASPPDGAADRAIEAYVHAPRDKTHAAAWAIWGPSIEVQDRSMPQELLRLYATLRTAPAAAAVLGVGGADSAEQIARAYALRKELLAAFLSPGATPHVQCRVAELTQRCDEAFEALRTGNPSLRTDSGPLASSAAGMTSPGRVSTPPAARGASSERAERLSASPRGDQSGSDSPPGSALDGLAGRVEALLRAGRHREVLGLLDSGKHKVLPFTLQLARAIAQRELARRRPQIGWILFALVLGAALGFALRHAGLGATLPRFFVR